MARQVKSKKDIMQSIKKFGVFYSDDECATVCSSLEEATNYAVKELEDSNMETEAYTICELILVRIVKASKVVVEEV